VDTRGLHGLREARGRGASLVNVPEARLVATIARHILGSSQREVDVGVISAYAEQTALLRRLLLHRNNQRQNGANGTAGNKNVLDRAALKHLEIDTVDAFEGREKDIIIVSLVRSNRRRDIGFLRLMQRINVALSRARTMLIVVGDTSTLRGSYFDRIVRYVRANGMLVPGPRLIGRLLNARTGERPERVGERPAGPGRRRRMLPSARTAFPERDPAAAAGPTEGAAAGEETGQRGRRRRRRVRGRPGSDRQGVERRGAPPSTTMEMSPTTEPGPDEPATQYEIDRFAALVEQLLGDSGADDAAPAGGETVAPEVDRAHAEEVLAEALRAVGEQERTGSSRSRRNNNRRRSRRGQGRPLPGDAAVADAARRRAEEERLAGTMSGPSELPLLDDGYPRLPNELPGESSAGDGRPAAATAAPTFRPADEAPASPFAPADQPPSLPAEPTPVAAPERPRRTRPRPAATGVSEASTPAPISGPDVAPPAEPPMTPPIAAPAEPTPSIEPTPAPRRTRRRAVAAEAPVAEAGPVTPTPVAAPPVEPVSIALPPLAAEPPTPAGPARRTGRRTAAATEEAPPTAVVTPTTSDAVAPADTPATEAPRRTRRRVAAAATEPPVAAAAAPIESVAPPPAAEVTAPQVAPRTRRRSTAAEPPSAPIAAPAPTPPAPKPRRTRAAVAATALPAEAPATNGAAEHGSTGDAAADTTPAPKPRRTRRKAAETPVVEASTDA
jgi:hypothetical protein